MHAKTAETLLELMQGVGTVFVAVIVGVIVMITTRCCWRRNDSDSRRAEAAEEGG
jgi:uncharacterized membrane protein YczE